MASLAPERFALAAPVPAAAMGAGRAPASVQVRGLARFGLAQSADACFCDRLPEGAWNVPPGTVVLCNAVVAPAIREGAPEAVVLEVPDPRACFIDFAERALEDGTVAVTNLVPRPFGVHPRARIGSGTVVHPESRIDADACIGANCVIHRGTWIGPGAIVRDNSTVGVPGINAYLGQDGRRRRFPHLAGTLIGAGAEIGAQVVVARGIVNSTCIGADATVGNLCNIGHVAQIGARVWMSVGCLVGGHTRIGDGASIGMGARIRDNLCIGAGAQVGMGSVVVASVPAEASVFGNPARAVPRIDAGPLR